jgi:hypothetical protein
MVLALVSAAALSLDAASAARFARLALKCVGQEYPNKLEHVMNGPAEVLPPRALHPVFYGCYDWHSSVHGHWMLARLLQKFPGMPEAAEIRSLLDGNLAPERIAAEVAYLDKPNRKSFERTYGWAWLLELSAELHGWPDAKQWAQNLQPLADRLAAALQDFLPRQNYPIRTGVHPNTAFGLSLALDYARAVRDEKLEALITERAQTYFGKDHDAPIRWEPGGEDFLSPVLEEAALMAKLLPPAKFRTWLRRFLPRFPRLEPAQVLDRTDPKLVHLDGLNLSRARTLNQIAAALGPGDPLSTRLRAMAEVHAEASLPWISSGSYEGEHWLATFAVQMLDARAAPK